MSHADLLARTVSHIDLKVRPHRVHRDRDEIGGVHLPFQPERTLMVNRVKESGRAPPTITSLG
jgi:hypothetical protein